MRRLPANQLTQQMYGQRIRFSIPVKRGQSVQTMTLGHCHVEPPWVLIRAQGADAWDAYRVRVDAVVEVQE